jgi:hypothetical protein
VPELARENRGSACGPVIVPVFKTGGRHLRCCRCVRLTHASAIYQQLADYEITRKSVYSRKRHANDLRVSMLHLIRHDVAINIHRGSDVRVTHQLLLDGD